MSQVIIITGASRGLGAAAAHIAAQLGARIVLNARSEADLRQVAERIEAAGGQALVIPGHVEQPGDAQHLIRQTVAHFGQIDALVNNAGTIAPIAPISESEPDELQYNLAVNLIGPMTLTRLALPYLRQRRGRVINVSSGAAVSAVPGWAAYCAAKAALNQFTKVLAAEERDIVTVALRPGRVDTKMQKQIRQEGEQVMDEGHYTSFVEGYKQGQLLPPERPGETLAWLALHAPRQLSGQFISWNDKQVQEMMAGE